MFEGWENFFLMIGGAGGGLIGLLFVVVTLTADFERTRALKGAALYMTPTAVQFAVVLAVSATAMIPRLAIWGTALLFGLFAAAGLGCATRSGVGIHGWKLGGENLHWTDFWLYAALPGMIYIGLLVSAVAFGQHADWAVHATAILLLALLLSGVRNAWDLVTWMTPHGEGDDRKAQPSADGLGAVAGDQAGADGVAIDAGEH